jgi:CheY-like chemotaxis protein
MLRDGLEEDMARVLIVDDDRALALPLAGCIETAGHEVTMASNGKEAVECFRETEFDIAFMDVRMPVMNGIDSFYEIREVRPAARVVLMTGTPEPKLQQVLRAGALALLVKPFETTAVMALLQGVVTPAIL